MFTRILSMFVIMRVGNENERRALKAHHEQMERDMRILEDMQVYMWLYGDLIYCVPHYFSKKVDTGKVLE